MQLKSYAADVLALRSINPVVRSIGQLALPDRLLHRLPVGDRAAQYRLRSGRTITLLNPRWDQVAKDIVWGKGQPTCRASANILQLLEESRPARFIDIGTYSGLFSLIAAANGATVTAFDLLPENYLMTLANIIENDMVGRIDVRLCGLSDHDETVRMPRSCDESSHPSGKSLNDRIATGVSVPVRTLDSFELPCDLVKIDVEGFEWPVIEGGLKTIAANRPVIICEVLSRLQGGPERIQQALQPLGYRFFLSTPEGFVERDEIVPHAELRDWIFTCHRQFP